MIEILNWAALPFMSLVFVGLLLWVLDVEVPHA